MPAVTGFLRSRGDRIRTCGILLPKRKLSLVADWVFPVVDSVLAVFLRYVLSADVSSYLTPFARLSHNGGSNMPPPNCLASARQNLGSSPLGSKSQPPAVTAGMSATTVVVSV